MIEAVLRFLIRCSHRSMTRPITPVDHSGVARWGTYVVRLDCGTQLPYDWEKMCIGRHARRPRTGDVWKPTQTRRRRSTSAELCRPTDEHFGSEGANCGMAKLSLSTITKRPWSTTVQQTNRPCHAKYWPRSLSFTAKVILLNHSRAPVKSASASTVSC
jgi:hypothetical protein